VTVRASDVNRRDQEVEGMSNANAVGASIAASIAGVLLVSNDAVTIQQLSESMQQLAMFPEVCGEVLAALDLLNRRKFDAVIVDLQLGVQANAILEKVRHSPANRTAVIFTISDSDAETASAFKAGSNFALRRPLSQTSIERNFKVAYGLIVRERRRYFRCPVEIPAMIRGPATPEIQGQTLNISEGGIAVNTAVSLGPGIKVQVEFTLPGQSFRFEAEAAVCWSKESYLGLQFTSLSPHLASELQEWLARRLEQSLPPSVAEKFRNLENAPPGTDKPPVGSGSGVTESGRNANAATEQQNWIALYRAALAESDTEKRLPKIELAEQNMKQRWRELSASGAEAGEERQRLKDALENLRGLR
jgi:ActR/RegA family two-component response regulator